MTQYSTIQNSKLALIIGQAPPEKNYEIPFSKTRLYKWLEEISITKEHAQSIFEFDALVRAFPGKTTKGHKIPSEIEIARDRPYLIKKININKFKVVIPVGKLAIRHTLNMEPDLNKVVGKSFYLSPFSGKTEATLVIPLPHPSGVSTWSFKESNRHLLHSALLLIKQNLIL